MKKIVALLIAMTLLLSSCSSDSVSYSDEYLDDLHFNAYWDGYDVGERDAMTDIANIYNDNIISPDVKASFYTISTYAEDANSPSEEELKDAIKTICDFCIDVSVYFSYLEEEDKNMIDIRRIYKKEE